MPGSKRWGCSLREIRQHLKIDMRGRYREKEVLSMKNRTRNTVESGRTRVAPVESSTEEDSGTHSSSRTGSKPVWACSYTLLWVWHHLTVPIASRELKVEYM